MLSALAPAWCSEATPDELEQRLRFYASQIKSLRTTSLMYSSPELIERIRQIEKDYEMAVRLFYCRPPSPTPSHMRAAAAQSRSCLQRAAAAQSTSFLQRAAAAQPTSCLQTAAAAVEKSTPGLQPAAEFPEGPEGGLPPLPHHVPEGPEDRLPPRPGPEHLRGVLTELRPDVQPDSRPDSPQPGMTPDPKSASTSSTRRRGRRKRGASARFIEGRGDATGPAHATEGLGNATAPAHATEGLGDTSAPTHATEGLGDASAPGLGNASAPAHVTEGPADTSAPAHVTEGPAPAHIIEGPADASAPAHITEGTADASAPASGLKVFQGFSDSLVLVLVPESPDEGFEDEPPPDPVPEDEGFEEEAPPDPVSGEFKEQLVLVLVSKGSPDSVPVSGDPVGSASASEGSPGTMNSKPDSNQLTPSLQGSCQGPSQTPDSSLRRGSGNAVDFLTPRFMGSSGLTAGILIGCSFGAGLHVFDAGLHAFAEDRPGLCVAGPGARLNSVPAGDDLLVARLNCFCFWPSYRGPHRPPELCFLFLALLPRPPPPA
ncbi:hypothetical protein CRENBAI_021316 [Crenichthys baileyi]|uniref:Uncharacterized protein n=1 Tax=Crenichthys baileyi TaxID=28760 RepID=A0AAV9R6K8_9TELE